MTLPLHSGLLILLALIVGGCLGSDPSPASNDSHLLRAGAAERIITPALGETYTDLNNNHRWEPDEPFQDLNGNGTFEPTWLANDILRPAQSVNDDLYATVIVIETDGQRVAFLGLDSFGHGYVELERIRTTPAFQSLGIDLLLMNSSHTHEGPDVVGLYGPSTLESGVDPDYMEFVRDQVIAAIREAVQTLRPAVMETAMSRTGLDTYQVDQRDPVIIDDHMSLMRVRDATSNRVIGTLINWASHPEQVINGSAISADYVGFMRLYQHIRHNGAIPVFFQGPLGGQIGSNNISFTHNGLSFDACGDCSFEKAQALGEILDEQIELTLANSIRETQPKLDWTQQEILIPLENVGFQSIFNAGTIERPLYRSDGTEHVGPIDTQVEEVYLLSEMVYLRLGALSLLTVPGELHPELAIGGYDGSFTPGGRDAIWSKDNLGIEDLSQAPPPPYLRDLLTTPVTMIGGVTQDFLGYIIPAFNYDLHPETPYVTSHDWDHHYEETNSLGPGITEIILDTANTLVPDSP